MTRPVLLAKPFVRVHSDGFYVLAKFDTDRDTLGPYDSHAEAMDRARNVVLTHPHRTTTSLIEAIEQGRQAR